MTITIYIFHVFVVIWILLFADSVGQRSKCPPDMTDVQYELPVTIVKVCQDDWASGIATVFLDTSSAPTYANVTCACSVTSEHRASVSASFTMNSNTDTIWFEFPTSNLTGRQQNGIFVFDKSLAFRYWSTTDHNTLPACLKLLLTVTENANHTENNFNVSCRRSVTYSSPTPTTQASSFVGTEEPKSTSYAPMAVGVSAGVLLIAVVIAAALIFIKRRRKYSEENPSENYNHEMENQTNTMVDTKQGIDEDSGDKYKENIIISDTYASVGYERVVEPSGINPVEETSGTKATDDYYSTVSKDRNRNVNKKSDTDKHGNTTLGIKGNGEQEMRTNPQHCFNTAFDGSSDVYNHLNEKETVQPVNVYGSLTTNGDHPKDLLKEYDHIEQQTGEMEHSKKDETYDSVI
ncbi:uncharacterized protein LOC128239072 [Mya arenaria]|uniref:uncharacterized protein LOC128239072 n=1 Tax=Mya arenaria TaxID=6604 RepID=UPI0022E6746A|nr:uncharacterized protein LOC128239072 [Mya arenaria]